MTGRCLGCFHHHWIMARPSSFSWLCAVLLWSCFCFSPHKGCVSAHGYSVNDDTSRSHASEFNPQTFNQFYSDDDLMYEMQDIRPQSPHPEDSQHASSISLTSEDEEAEKREPDSHPEPVVAAPSLQKYDFADAGSRHPFGLLVKDHTQETAVDGVSFPTMTNFKQFIGRMKSSFLKPGSDVRRHFQTAQEIIEKTMESNAQDTEEEPDAGYKYESENGGEELQEESDEEKAWSEFMNKVFEEREYGPTYQMPSEDPAGPEPDDSYESPNSALDNDNLSYYSPAYKKNIPQPGSSLAHQPEPLNPDFQHGRLTPPNVISAPEPRSLSSYGKSVLVNAPKGQLHIPKHPPKQRPASTFPAYPPTSGEESNQISPSGHPSAATGSSPHIPVKPPSDYNGGNLRDSRFTVPRPSIRPAWIKDEEESNLSKQNHIFAIQKPKQTENKPLPVSGGSNSRRPTGILFEAGVGYARFNSLAPASEKTFRRFLGDKVKNTKTLRRFPILSGSFSIPQRRGFSFNTGFVKAQSLVPRTKVWKRPFFVGARNMALKHLQPPRVSGSYLSQKGGNTKGPYWLKGPIMLPKSLYILQSKNSYLRGKESRSRTRYEPNQVDGDQWKQKARTQLLPTMLKDPEHERSKGSVFLISREEHHVPAALQSSAGIIKKH